MSSLYDILNSRDDKSLSKSPTSIRLPIHVLARVQALKDMHPSRSQNDLLIELIKGGLDALEASMPPIVLRKEEIDDGVFGEVATGYRADYQLKSNYYYKAMEYKIFNRVAHSHALFDIPGEVKQTIVSGGSWKDEEEES